MGLELRELLLQRGIQAQVSTPFTSRSSKQEAKVKGTRFSRGQGEYHFACCKKMKDITSNFKNITIINFRSKLNQRGGPPKKTWSN